MEYHKYITANEASLKLSSECACLACLRKFNPKLIQGWTDAHLYGQINRTAICPFCGIDSLMPRFSINYTDAQLLIWHHSGFK